MGTWGTRAFENDDAGDWLFQFADTGAPAVEAALADAEAGRASDYVEAPEGAVFLIAAEVLAAAHGRPAPWVADVPVGESERLSDLVLRHSPSVTALESAVTRSLDLAAFVLEDVDGSELLQLWEDAAPAHRESFVAAGADLVARLESVA